MEKRTYSAAEAAKSIGVSRSTMYQLMNQQGFPVLHIGKRKVIPISALEKWIENHTGGEG